MPVDNLEAKRREHEIRARKLDEQWRNGRIIGVGEDVDPYVRFRLKQEMENKPPKRERL